MSNSIWKTPYQKPDVFKPYIIMVVYEAHDEAELILSTQYEAYAADRYINRWCYLDDLIAQADKAERLQKGIDLLFRQASVWSWQTAPTPDKKIVLSRRQILGWLKKLKEIVKGE